MAGGPGHRPRLRASTGFNGDPKSRNQASKHPIGGPQKIRIIGGRWKRTLELTPRFDSLGLRPTPDRVRETLFNWIGPAVIGTRVLDLFAGTGALGFEAASRGAAEVTVVERDARVMAGIRSLQDRLKADEITLLAVDAQSAIDQAQWQKKLFDLVLLRPAIWTRLVTEYRASPRQCACEYRAGLP